MYKDKIGKAFFYALDEEETEPSAQVGAVLVETEVEVRNRALKDLEIKLVGLGDR